ncbi:ribonuclease H-like domain-containing protein [Edaphocola aurantiacus]|uniref:ribonuclease H-like domain-containing protein n=1 Tax=Edaphocola aurantiacus TaxID=2601682 RepID=UPI001C97EA32|nr:ribonuclease H-like domain-containing protein [Edaphocola aurantiacus]
MKSKTSPQILIIDIETVSEHADITNLEESIREHWIHKSSFLKLSETELADPAESYRNRACIYAEFGKVICIGLGIIDAKNKQIRIKSIADHDEQTVLQTFADTIKEISEQHPAIIFCGHNIKEFDLPYLCRRFTVQGLSLPDCLQLNGLKPWEVPHIDTLNLWRFGDYKHFISLDLLARTLKLPSSKTEMSGSEVGHNYWIENDLPGIAHYCMSDIYTTALVYMRLTQQSSDGYEPCYV